MKIIQLTYPITMNQAEIPKTVAAIGFFDGIHKGHQKVIHSAVKKAKSLQMESAVITFHPHPSVVLRQDAERVKYITPIAEKEKILKELDVDRLYMITFNHVLSKLAPKEFIDHFIIGLNIKHLIAGFDYTYGHKGKGNMKNITEYAEDKFSVTVIDKVNADDIKISSTRIRSLLEDGNISKVNELLGRKFIVSGLVVDGDKRGRTIGYPTANIDVNKDALLPRLGVYAVIIKVNRQLYQGMANIGVRPTFIKDDVKPTLEVNIFDFDEEIYGKSVEVELHQFIRPEMRFSGIDSLVSQIQSDEEQIKNYFSKE